MFIKGGSRLIWQERCAAHNPVYMPITVCITTASSSDSCETRPIHSNVNNNHKRYTYSPYTYSSYKYSPYTHSLYTHSPYENCLPAAEVQYQSLQRLLDGFSTYATRAPNAHLRPRTRPQQGRSAAKWWRYAGTVVQRQQKCRITWEQLQLVCHLRKEYIPHYIK